MRQKADGMRPDLVNDGFLSLIIIHFKTNHGESIGNQLRNLMFQGFRKMLNQEIHVCNFTRAFITVFTKYSH